MAHKPCVVLPRAGAAEAFGSLTVSMGKLPRIALALLLLLGSLPLAAAGHDIAPIRYAATSLAPGQAAIAYNGTHFLTLWRARHIYSSLEDASGRSLSQIVAAVPFANSDILQVTAAGSGYAAIWNQESATPMLGTFSSDGVLERRVRLDGGKFVAPRLAFNGSNVLVVDQIGTPTNAIAVSVYAVTGRMVNQFVLPVLIDESYAVTQAGGDFIVVTGGRSGINEWRIAADGTIVSTLQIEAPPRRAALFDVAVTAKNGRIEIAWEQRQFTTVSSAVIQPDGSITRYVVAIGIGPVSGAAILPVDAGFAVVWNEQRTLNENRVMAALLNDAGVPLSAGPFALGKGPFTAAVTSGKVIELTLSTPPGEYAKLIADVDVNDVTPRPPGVTAIMPVRQLFPMVVGNGAGFTAVWLDKTSDAQNAMAARITPMGEALDGPGITLGVNASQPVIAHGSSGELAVWNANGHLLAARLLPSGAVFDVQPIVIGPSTSGSYNVAWNGSRFFVVWTDGRQLFGALIGPDGIATPPRPLGIQSPLSGASDLDLCWDGRQFIVVFGETTPQPCPIMECQDVPDHIRLVRVSADGIAVDSNPVGIPGYHIRAHVASSGTESMLALDDDTNTSAMLLRDDGAGIQLGPEIRLFHWINTFGSDIAWTGSQYVVTWRYAYELTGPGYIGASRISQSGIVLGSLFTPTAGPPESFPPYSIPSVAANDAGDAAIVISEVAPPSYSARARLYLTSEMAPMPSPAPVPRNVVTYVTGNTTMITWQSEGTQLGFLIEVSPDFGKSWFPRDFPGDVRTVTLTSHPQATLFRVSAIGPGGFSEPAVSTFGRIDRRRAARP
jgi:hypothetical protein